MLEKVNTIPWHTLSYSMGNASNVPALFQDLLSSSDEEQWFHALFILTHFKQGWPHNTVYSATPYIVPFLIELVSSPEVPNRDRILSRLGSFAGYALSQEENTKLTREAVAQGYEVFIQLLSDEDPLVRCFVVEPLDFLHEFHNRTLPVVRDRLRIEQDDLVKTSLLRYLEHHDPLFFEDPQHFSEYVLQAESDSLSRAMFILASVRQRKEQTHPSMIQTLFDLFQQSDIFTQKYCQLPGYRPTFLEQVCHCYRLFSLGLAEEVIPILLEMFHKLDEIYAAEKEAFLDGFAIGHITEGLLLFAFQGQSLPTDPLVVPLTPLQQTVLQTILKSEIALNILELVHLEPILQFLEKSGPDKAVEALPALIEILKQTSCSTEEGKRKRELVWPLIDAFSPEQIAPYSSVIDELLEGR